MFNTPVLQPFTDSDQCGVQIILFQIDINYFITMTDR